MHTDRSLLEPLEDRIAPATLVDASTVTYQDVDGDAVTVKFSKPVFSGGNTGDFMNVFNFNFNNYADNADPQQLRHIDLGMLTDPSIAAGTDITLTVKKANNTTLNLFGDGFANTGTITATGIDLGKVTLKGDLSKIVAGDTDYTTAGIGILNTQSFGVFGGTTQIMADNVSTVQGGVKTLAVKSDFSSAFFEVQNGGIGTISIGGSLEGGTAAFAGMISSAGSITSVNIGKDIRGNDGLDSASIYVTGGSVGTVKVGGSIIGGTGDASGAVYASVSIGSVTVGGDILGGAGDYSGWVSSSTILGAVKLGGSLQGGGGTFSGNITAAVDILGSVSIGKDLHGGAGNYSGSLLSQTGSIGSVKVGGSVIGGGYVLSYTMGTVSGDHSGSISAAQAIKDVTIGKDLIGGMADNSGKIESINSTIGTVKIGGSIQGGGQFFGTPLITTGTESGSIEAAGTITSVTVAKTVQGDLGFRSGLIASTASGISLVSIGGSLVGGAGTNSGNIRVAGDITTLTIGGDVVGEYGTNSAFIEGASANSISIKGNIFGGNGSNSGYLNFTGDVKTLSIGKDIRGSSGFSSARIYVNGDLTSGKVGGSIVGSGGSSGVISIGGKAVSLAIGGDVKGGTGDSSGAVSSEEGFDVLSIKGSLIGGSASSAGLIYAGIDPVTLAPTNKISIGRDIVGGTGASGSGTILVLTAQSISVGGSITGATVKTGANGIVERSGGISAIIFDGSDGSIGTVTVGKNIVGGSATGAYMLDKSGFIIAEGSLGTVTVGGSLIAGVDDTSGTFKNSGFIGAGSGAAMQIASTDGTIDSLTIKGGLLGNSTNKAVISARGLSGNALATATSDVALGKVTIGGSLTHASLLAGYAIDGTQKDGSAQITSVSINGGFTASNIVAGSLPSGTGFGSASDNIPAATVTPGIAARIAAITIKGQVAPDASGMGYDGISANEYGTVKIGPNTLTTFINTLPFSTPYNLTPWRALGEGSVSLVKAPVMA